MCIAGGQTVRDPNRQPLGCPVAFHGSTAQFVSLRQMNGRQIRTIYYRPHK
jgi:hypothetical protein